MYIITLTGYIINVYYYADGLYIYYCTDGLYNRYMLVPRCDAFVVIQINDTHICVHNVIN